MASRSHTLSVRVSDAERDAIRDRATAQGIDVSEYVRRVALSHDRRTDVPPGLIGVLLVVTLAVILGVLR